MLVLRWASCVALDLPLRFSEYIDSMLYAWLLELYLEINIDGIVKIIMLEPCNFR